MAYTCKHDDPRTLSLTLLFPRDVNPLVQPAIDARDLIRITSALDEAALSKEQLGWSRRKVSFGEPMTVDSRVLKNGHDALYSRLKIHYGFDAAQSTAEKIRFKTAVAQVLDDKGLGNFLQEKIFANALP